MRSNGVLKRRAVLGVVGFVSAVIMNLCGGSLPPKTEEASAAEPMARMRPDMSGGEELSPRLVVNTKNHTITLEVRGESPLVMAAQGAYAMRQGTYTVKSKEKDPKWIAPPTYFLRRGLQVPTEGDASRELGGALGHQALLLDNAQQIAIHSGPAWNQEVGGIRVSRDDMARLFARIDVGTRIEVR